MKVLVAIKRVVDYNVRVRVRADQTAVETDGVKMSINPFCEIAVEEAVRLKEKGVAKEVVAVSIGPAVAQEQLRLALALGADRALLLETEQSVDSLQVAQLLHKVVEREAPDLVILGKQAIDSDNNQTGQMLAGMWGKAQGTFASQLEITEGKILVTREVDGGLRTLALRLPAVITTDLRLNEPRYASLPNIMKAKRKPLDVEPADSLGVDLTPGVAVLEVTPPKQRSGGIRVESVDELVEKLQQEARVL